MATNKGVYYIPTEDERELFWTAHSPRCVGHLRGYFDGDIFCHCWFPDAADATENNEQFKREFGALMASLIDAEFQSQKSAKILWKCAMPLDDDIERGLKLMSEHYEYYIRVPEFLGKMYTYIYCYVKEAN